MVKNIYTLIFVLGLMIIAFLAGNFNWFSAESSPDKLIKSNNLEVGEYPLINKSVTAGTGKHFIINFKPLKESLLKIQARYPQNTYVYFDYLNNASWVGLGEREEFIAASTIKVPLAMATMKAAEDNKISLSDVYSLEEVDLDDAFGDLYKVGSDKEITIRDLVRIMLQQSDNTAMFAVLNVFKKLGIDDPFFAVYSAIGWDVGDINMVSRIGEPINYQKINLKTLSNMFVALYNAKYVNVEHSQEILKYLSETPFDDKIKQGVPDQVVVSHKIGISSSEGVFSDCGVIYVPNRNYLLCLGSSGSNEDGANNFMAEASRAVYSYVINN